MIKPTISRRSSSLLFLLALSTPAITRACIHGPRDYTEAIAEGTKQALLFHDGQNAHLVISTQLQSAKLPPTMAWIIPLPALPSHYEEADPELFSDLYKLTEPPMDHSLPQAGALSAPGSAAPSSAIIVHDARTVGDYRVQPIEIASSGDEAAAALNDWLQQNGFGTVPAENQRFYLKRGAVFLALKIEKLSGSTSQIKPLHIVYPSDRLSMPLKFSSHSGVFNVILYTFTPKPLNPTALRAFHISQFRTWHGTSPAPASLLKLIGARPGTLTRWSGHNFNTPYNMVADLPDDPTLMIDGSTPSQFPITIWLPMLGALAISGAAILAFRKRKS